MQSSSERVSVAAAVLLSCAMESGASAMPKKAIAIKANRNGKIYLSGFLTVVIYLSFLLQIALMLATASAVCACILLQI